MYTTTVLASTLMAAVASAQTVLPPQLGYFVIDAFQQTSQGPGFVEPVLLHASGGYFYTNQGTSASCAGGSGSCCTANSATSFVVLENLQQDGTSGPAALYMNTAGISSNETRQQVFCSQGGTLQYTQPGSPVPHDAQPLSTFVYTPEASRVDYGGIKNDATNFTVCTNSNGYKQLFCTASHPEATDCEDTPLATRPDFQGIAAGQYN